MEKRRDVLVLLPLAAIACVGLAIALFSAPRTEGKAAATVKPVQAPQASKPSSPPVVVNYGRGGSSQVGDSVLSLAFGAETIVVGTVQSNTGNYKYLRDQTPLTHPCQRTYSFSVDQVLKGSVSANTTITVVQYAGAVLNGSTYRWRELPWLVVGDKYILFLDSWGSDPASVDDGYVKGVLAHGDSSQLSGKIAELTEHTIHSDTQGVIKIVNQVAVPNSDGTYTSPSTEFSDYAIWNQSESTAIANISSAVAEVVDIDSGP